MTKEIERRVNKAFVVPTDVDGPKIDPGLSELEADRSYDRIEELRAERAAADTAETPQARDAGELVQEVDAERAAAISESQVGMAQVDLASAQAEADREALVREWNVGATSTASTIDEEHFDALQEHAQDLSADANAGVDANPDDVMPSNYP